MTLVSLLKQAVIGDLKSRYESVGAKELLNKSYFLDPRFKASVFTE